MKSLHQYHHQRDSLVGKFADDCYTPRPAAYWSAVKQTEKRATSPLRRWFRRGLRRLLGWVAD